MHVPLQWSGGVMGRELTSWAPHTWTCAEAEQRTVLQFFRSKNAGKAGSKPDHRSYFTLESLLLMQFLIIIPNLFKVGVSDSWEGLLKDIWNLQPDLLSLSFPLPPVPRLSFPPVLCTSTKSPCCWLAGIALCGPVQAALFVSHLQSQDCVQTPFFFSTHTINR